MATQGNIKISELTNHTSLTGREVIPMSWEQTAGSGQFETYKMTVDALKSYMGPALGLTSNNSNQGAMAYINSYGGRLTNLERDLGQYAADGASGQATAESFTLSTGISNQAVLMTGNAASKSGYNISQPIKVKAGTIYLLRLPEAFSDATVCLFARRHTHTYHIITGYQDVIVPDANGGTTTVREPVYGAEQTDVTYEPMSSHYATRTAGGYGLPKSGYVSFMASEDEEIVISAPSTVFTNAQYNQVLAVHYGVFAEICDKFLAVNSDLSRVVAEVCANLDGRIDSLERGIDWLGNANAQSIDVMEHLKFKGHDTVVNAKEAPRSVATATQPVDVPNHKGQIWISDNDEVFIATGVGEYSKWKKITLS